MKRKNSDEKQYLLQLLRRRRIDPYKSTYTTATNVDYTNVIDDDYDDDYEDDEDHQNDGSYQKIKQEETRLLKKKETLNIASTSCNSKFDREKLMNDTNTKLQQKLTKTSRIKLTPFDIVSGSGSKFNRTIVRKNGPMFEDLSGMKEIIEEIKNKILWPMFNPKMCGMLGVKPIGGILLHGVPGCGKARLAHAIANETGYKFYPTSATKLLSSGIGIFSGVKKTKIKDLFSKAKATSQSIIFIDEIDIIASKSEGVKQLITCMDDVNDDGSETSHKPRGHILVIGTTNKLNDIESALRRPGRFDHEILVPLPDESSREKILSLVTRDQKHDNSIDLRKIAMSTPGFVGADLAALAKAAGIVAMDRLRDEMKHKLSHLGAITNDQNWWKKPQGDLKKCKVTMSDFEEASKKVRPSPKREGFTAIPNVKWEDVGALDHVRQEFDNYIIKRIKHPEDFKGLVRNLESGFLLYGPPGCGKTLIAKAVANKAGAHFIHVKGPELLNKYLGESEQEVRKLFSRARSCTPCIIFFDEVDALTKERGKAHGGWRSFEGVLNQLLVELDGGQNRKGVFVIGATNRFEVLDPAILRPGRLGKHLYVPLPSPDDRVKILKTLANGMLIDASVDLSVIARMKDCENFSGADLAALMEEAGMAALTEKWNSTEKTSGTIKTCHFEEALKKVSPSVSAKQRKYYQQMSEKH